ncbi:uncharacterized protein LOC112567712 isoform X2 [Pomacea canaliculata]|nr:uncharacterized protein LOC112567712 isoform X2 [Pomacea canaliculata]
MIISVRPCEKSSWQFATSLEGKWALRTARNTIYYACALRPLVVSLCVIIWETSGQHSGCGHDAFRVYEQPRGDKNNLLSEDFRLQEPPGDPTVTCVKYISEGESGTCNCEARFHDDKPPDFSLMWPGLSNNSTLQLTKVTREKNGTVFTCLMIWNGHRRTANYTLQVAYGPDNAHTNIVGPRSFITDGRRPLTLTCRATDTNPSPIYTWDTNRCDIEDPVAGTCTFTPEPLRDDGQRIQCSARSDAENNNKGMADFVLNLTYPPKDPPSITGYTPGTVISHGAQLQCSVTGGKPMVSKVIFTCEKLQLVSADSQTIQPENASVSSILTIDSKNNRVECKCQAVWDPEESLYTLTSQIVVLTQREDINVKKETTNTLPYHVAQIILIVMVTPSMVVIWILVKRYRASQKKRTTAEEGESLKTFT